MTPDRYQELLRSNMCYTIDSTDQILFLSPGGNLLIEINNISSSSSGESFADNDSRILIFVYPSLNAKSELHVKQLVSNEAIVLIKSENDGEATSYKLTIDEYNEEVSLKIWDFPEDGKTIIPQKEILGIHKKLWKPQNFTRP